MESKLRIIIGLEIEFFAIEENLKKGDEVMLKGGHVKPAAPQPPHHFVFNFFFSFHFSLHQLGTMLT